MEQTYFMCLLVGCNGTYYLMWYFCQKSIPESNPAETSDKPKVRDIPLNNWLVLFKNIQVRKIENG